MSKEIEELRKRVEKLEDLVSDLQDCNCDNEDEERESFDIRCFYKELRRKIYFFLFKRRWPILIKLQKRGIIKWSYTFIEGRGYRLFDTFDDLVQHFVKKDCVVDWTINPTGKRGHVFSAWYFNFPWRRQKSVWK